MRTTLRAAALAVALALAGLAAAQDAPKAKDKEPDKTKEVAKPFTHKSLKEAIEKIGYEPQVLGDDKNVYRVTVELPDFRSVFDVSLSKDEKVLWVYTWQNLSDPDAIPADALRELLRAGYEIYPAQFTLDRKAKRLYLQRQTPNRASTAADLRELIESFAAAVKKTYPKWTYATLQPPAPVKDTQASAKLRQKLLGEWAIESLTRDGVTKKADQFQGTVYRFRGKTATYTGGPLMQVSLQEAGERLEIDLHLALNQKQACLAELDGDVLTLCLPPVNGKRPEKLTGEKGSGCTLIVLKRKK